MLVAVNRKRKKVVISENFELVALRVNYKTEMYIMEE
jgi:hypothetical protein